MIVDFNDRNRVLAHEAGHALVAWASPSFLPPLGICFYPMFEKAECLLSFPKPDTVSGYLETTSVFLGGCAGEMVALGDFERIIGSDLAWAISAAKVVRAMGHLPRARRKGPATDFRRKLPHGLHAGMKEFLNLSYDLAVSRIETHHEAYTRLRDHLIIGYAVGRIEFSADEIAERLGPRPF